MVKLRRVVTRENTGIVTEMAQPRHKLVTLVIPLHHDNDKINISFESKKSTRNKEINRFIDMADTADPRVAGRIEKQVYLPNVSDTNAAVRDRQQEIADLQDFANQVANKYGSGDSHIMQGIRDAITTCYNEIVVDHQALAQARLPSDYYHVIWDSTQGKIVPIS